MKVFSLMRFLNVEPITDQKFSRISGALYWFIKLSLLFVVDLNPCVTNPCLNGGMCTMEREDFLCLCPPQYHGRLCDSGRPHLVLTKEDHRIPDLDMFC